MVLKSARRRLTSAPSKTASLAPRKKRRRPQVLSPAPIVLSGRAGA
jgi:hypothetical protein